MKNGHERSRRPHRRKVRGPRRGSPRPTTPGTPVDQHASCYERSQFLLNLIPADRRRRALAHLARVKERAAKLSGAERDRFIAAELRKGLPSDRGRYARRPSSPAWLGSAYMLLTNAHRDAGGELDLIRAAIEGQRAVLEGLDAASRALGLDGAVPPIGPIINALERAGEKSTPRLFALQVLADVLGVHVDAGSGWDDRVRKQIARQVERSVAALREQRSSMGLPAEVTTDPGDTAGDLVARAVTLATRARAVLREVAGTAGDHPDLDRLRAGATLVDGYLGWLFTLLPPAPRTD